MCAGRSLTGAELSPWKGAACSGCWLGFELGATCTPPMTQALPAGHSTPRPSTKPNCARKPPGRGGRPLRSPRQLPADTDPTPTQGLLAPGGLCLCSNTQVAGTGASPLHVADGNGDPARGGGCCRDLRGQSWVPLLPR